MSSSKNKQPFYIQNELKEQITAQLQLLDSQVEFISFNDTSEIKPHSKKVIFICCKSLIEISGLKSQSSIMIFTNEQPVDVDSLVSLTENNSVMGLFWV